MSKSVKLGMAIVATLGVGLLGAGGAGAGGQIRGTNGCGEFQVEPEEVLFACADAGIRASGLVWTGWGNRHATATGTLYVTSCVPSCGTGPVQTSPVTVRFRKAERVRTCRGRTILAYRKYRLFVSGAEPQGFDQFGKGRLRRYC